MYTKKAAGANAFAKTIANGRKNPNIRMRMDALEAPFTARRGAEAGTRRAVVRSHPRIPRSMRRPASSFAPAIKPVRGQAA
jgi:hypothetical protein